MQSIHSVFVTGATGNQGGSVARNLAARGVRVRALTRDPLSASAKSLKDPGIEVVKGDLNDPDSYREYLKDVDGVFSVQHFTDGVDKEVRQGIKLADTAKENNIKHFIYSSVIGSDLPTGIPHWESKYKIEQHIKAVDIPHTILRPTFFYENFQLPQVKSRIVKGKLVAPLDKQKVQQLISAEDVGMVSGIIFMNPEKYLSKTITLAAEEMSQEEIAQTFTEVLGREVKFSKLPGIITRLAMGKDLHKMFKWLNSNDACFVKDMDGLKREFPDMMTLRQWIKMKFHKS